MLENGAANAAKNGNAREKVELEAEVRALSKLRAQTLQKIERLKKSQ